jgi:hypothetical protein
MAGFANVAAWSNAKDSGNYHISTFRKAVASAATVANDFVDYTYFAGNPVANFYASSPLEAAVVEANRGIYIPSVSPASQFVKCITVMSAASSATGTSNQNQRLLLADYLMYYPFVDTDAVGEQQDTIQTTSLPRYTSGEGVQMMAVAQSAASTVGQFTVRYTNSDGVSGRTSQNTFTKVVSGGGTLVSSTSNAVAGSQPFIQLQAGDKGVRSVESVTFTAAGGGLMCLVLVKPLQHFYSTQECRRTTTGNLESYGAASQFESVIHRAPVRIQDGALLGIIGLGNAGSLASSVLVGTLETTWS